MIWILGLHFLNILTKAESSEKIENFVINGQDVDIRNAPYFAIIVKSCGILKSICGSSILTNDILLSAAHCFNNCENGDFVAAAGYDKRDIENAEQILKVSNFKCHENYSEKILSNDISLVLLEKKLQYNEKIKRVAIYNRLINAKTAYLAGLGRVDQNQTPNRLQGMITKVINPNTCKNDFSQLPNGTICGRGLNSSAARGDSGSPLIANGYIQIGLVSFKRDVIRSFTVYTDVSYFFKWIKKVCIEMRCWKDKKSSQ